MLNWSFKRGFAGRYVMNGVSPSGKKFKYTYNIYECNGLFVVVEETKKTYKVQTYAVDKQHFARMEKDFCANYTVTFILNAGHAKLAKDIVSVVAKYGISSVEIRPKAHPVRKVYSKTLVGD